MQEDRPNESALELRLRQTNRYVTLGLMAVLLLSVLGFIYLASVKESENVAQTNQQVQSKIIIDSEVCKVYPDQELCVLARTIAANPDEAVVPKDGEPGRNGDNGSDGRGIARFDSGSGNLIVTYTDNATQDLGRIVGKDGSKGDTGGNGEDGRGIVSTDIVSGSLIVSFSDGTVQNAGIVVGPRGAAGETGATGAAGENGTGETGPTGPTGPPGLTPKSVDTDPLGNVTITYNDGTTSQAGKIMFPAVEIFECTADGKSLTLKLTNGPAKTITMDCTPEALAPAAPVAPAPVPVAPAAAATKP